MKPSPTLTALALAASVSATFQGFNYGNRFTDGRIKVEADYEAEFRAAQGLDGTDGAFNSARLYTMIQGGSTNSPIQAIQAAINTKTSLLLGMWCSAGPDVFANELSALKNTIDQYGDDLNGLIAGISIGSEDLYRITPTGIANGEFAGAGPDVLADYINQVRELISGTPISGAKLGHVDTWTAWVNGSNKAVVDAVDWVGMDAYPYFEKEHGNHVNNSKQLFAEALGATAGTGKEVWITETGWPVSGKTVGEAVPGVDEAKMFWDWVGCPMFGATNVWWYTFQDALPDIPNPSFGVISSELTTTPLYDLSCSNLVPLPEGQDPETPGGDGDGDDDTSKPDDSDGVDGDEDEGNNGGGDDDADSGDTTADGDGDAEEEDQPEAEEEPAEEQEEEEEVEPESDNDENTAGDDDDDDSGDSGNGDDSDSDSGNDGDSSDGDDNGGSSDDNTSGGSTDEDNEDSGDDDGDTTSGSGSGSSEDDEESRTGTNGGSSSGDSSSSDGGDGDGESGSGGDSSSSDSSSSDSSSSSSSGGNDSGSGNGGGGGSDTDNSGGDGNDEIAGSDNDTNDAARTKSFGAAVVAVVMAMFVL